MTNRYSFYHFWVFSSIWLELPSDTRKVPGSSPGRPTKDFQVRLNLVVQEASTDTGDVKKYVDAPTAK